MNKILVIKSSSRAYQKALEHFRGKFPKAKIDVLVTSQQDQAVEANPEMGEIIEVEAKSFGLSALTDKELRDLRGEDYDLIVILYNNIYKFGYGNVEKLALNLSPGKIRGFDRYSRDWPLDTFHRITLFLTRLLLVPAVFLLDVLTIIFVLIYFVPALLWRTIKQSIKS